MTLPEDKLPQCWSDDVRMNALFAPFRLRTVNPESWEMKMKFWTEMLNQWCRCKMDPVVSAADAKFAFQRKGRTPACLEIIIEEMFRNGELSPYSKYLQILHNGPEGWVRWGARLAFKPAAFALTAVTSLLPARQAVDNDGLPKASIDCTQKFVLESAVKDQATSLLDQYPFGHERLGTIEELIKITAWKGSRETFEILLGYLVSQGSAVKKGDVVKLAEPSKKATAVTDADEALVKLLSAETRLECDAARLSRDIAATEVDAKAALQLGNRLAAKNHLRRKHKLVQRSDRCQNALDNVQHLLHQLREVDANTIIYNTYKTGSEAMKRGMKDSGLEEDAVHETMDDLKEVMQTYNEVEKALAGTTDDFDAAELEQELSDLMAGPGAPGGGIPAREVKKEVSKLPTPPTQLPDRKTPEQFVFDGEERIIAELNELSVQDSSPKEKEKKIALAEAIAAEPPKLSPSKSKSWYPPSNQCLHLSTWNNNNGFGELRQDDRLHPGQQLNIDFSTAPSLYGNDFAVLDHKLSSGVWLYNADNNNHSTEFVSPEDQSQTKEKPFQMAPGGERRKPQPWPTEESTVDNIERRLKNLRGFNL